MKKYTNNVSSTLMIPLKAKYIESKKSDGFFTDKKAEEIIDKTNSDSKIFKLDQVGTSIRVKYFDDALKHFSNDNDNVIAVILGCGLDDRQGRTELKGIPFVHIDFPDVIDSREQWFEKNQENIDIGTSILNNDWVKVIKNKYPDRQPIFILEGVSMYLSDIEIKQLINLLKANFDNFELWLDILSKKILKQKNKQKDFKSNDVTFKWGMDKKEELESFLGSGFKIIKYDYMMKMYPEKWGWWYYLANIVPTIGKSSQLVGLSFNR